MELSAANQEYVKEKDELTSKLNVAHNKNFELYNKLTEVKNQLSLQINANNELCDKMKEIQNKLLTTFKTKPGSIAELKAEVNVAISKSDHSSREKPITCQPPQWSKKTIDNTE